MLESVQTPIMIICLFNLLVIAWVTGYYGFFRVDQDKFGFWVLVTYCTWAIELAVGIWI